MPPSSFLIRLALPVFFAIAHAAQSAQFDQQSSNTLGELPLSDSSGAFTRTSAAELTGDFRADVAMLVGSEVVISISPGIYDAFISLDTVGVDMVCMEGSAAGQLGSVLVSTPSAGLQRWTLDPETLTFFSTTIGSALWSGAVELYVGDVTADGVQDLVGLTANRQTVIWLSGALETGVEGSLALTETAHRLLTLEWDGTAGEELALFTSGGIRVLETSGSLRLAQALDGDDSDRFTVIHRAGQTDRLASLVRLPDQIYRFFVADQLHWDSLSQIGNFPLVSLVSADFDGDGLDDACVTHKLSRDPYYFENQAGATTSFGWGSYAAWNLASGAGPSDDPNLNLVTPTLCDLDGDEDVDVFHPFNLTPASGYERIVRMCRSVRLDHLRNAPRVRAASYDAVAGGASGVLSLELLRPLDPPAENDALSVVVWTAPVLIEGMPTSDISVHDALASVAWSPSSPVQTIQIPLTFPLWEEDVFHIEMRMVETDQQPEPTVTSASAAALWTFSTGGTSIANFAEYGVVGGVEVTVSEFGAAVGGGGWTGPMPCLPCFPDDKLPNPKGGN